MKQLVFIGGTGGSGTRALAQAISNVGFYAGTNLNKERDSMFIEQSFLDKWVRNYMAGKHCDINEVRESFNKAIELQLPDSDGKNCVIKAVRSAFILPLIWSASPNFKYIHMVRDGRDMAFSPNHKYVEYYAHFWFPEEPQWIKGKHPKGMFSKDWKRMAKMWNEQNMRAYKCGKTMGDNYMFIKYEDLCINNREAYRRLANFIGVDEEKMWEQKDGIKLSKRYGGWTNKGGDIIKVLSELTKEGLNEFGYYE